MVNDNGVLVFNGWRYNEPTGGKQCARIKTFSDRTAYWLDVGDNGCDSTLYNVICKRGKVIFVIYVGPFLSSHFR